MKSVIKKKEYVLIVPIKGRGIVGDIVNVAPGYGRYLERYNFAVRLNSINKEELEAKKLEWTKASKDKETKARLVIEEIKKIGNIVLFKKVSQSNKLYQSIRREDVVEYLKTKHNIEIEAKSVFINGMIKTLGVFEIVINVFGSHEVKVALEVQAMV